jgi:hypothetical protein
VAAKEICRLGGCSVWRHNQVRVKQLVQPGCRPYFSLRARSSLADTALAFQCSSLSRSMRRRRSTIRSRRAKGRSIARNRHSRKPPCACRRSIGLQVNTGRFPKRHKAGGWLRSDAEKWLTEHEGEGR